MASTHITASDGKIMVMIPHGSFTMGSEEFENEGPMRQVFLPDYFIDIYPVTNAEYKRYMDATSAMFPRHWGGFEVPPGLENHPVHRISWFEAVMYAEWASKRLPTEAEWEKAARGTDARRWSWGNNMNEANTLVWDRGEFMMTAPVDAHPGGASPYGVFETGGNVEEWCADWYDAYPGSPYRSKAYGKRFKVLRGGNSFFTMNHARCAYRCFTRPEDSGIEGVVGAGFRCVMDYVEGLNLLS